MSRGSIGTYVWAVLTSCIMECEVLCMPLEALETQLAELRTQLESAQYGAAGKFGS